MIDRRVKERRAKAEEFNGVLAVELSTFSC